MGIDLLMYTLMFLGHLVSVSLAMGIFISIFVKSRKKGFVFLAIYILLNIYTLTVGFDYSAVMGVGMLIIYIGIGLLAYFVIRKRLSNVATIDL
ncbi:hypothetical protein SAMN05192533_101527 [Mesobacillus persicus]|uniref:Inner membrane protein n=1 Tax=Mesobacillus persicus TaxID=930146 RepID=A0A1H7WQI2_9BACI|nr:hypothetical protein [Mesobacillus persicus]SEM23217.1 hypothetical protein SAMN05192533_101527 [Mesobacillus persicus]